MSWTEKYWEAMEQLYWAPAYFGLNSIPKKLWAVEEDTVTVPRSMVNMNGGLYRRVGKSKDYDAKVRLFEETFNHLFDLTFGILDGRIVNDIFCDALGGSRVDCLKSYGRTLGEAFGYADLYGVSQPDGYFVGTDWTLAVELKFDAATSLDQLAKYVLAFCVERAHSDQRKPLTLLYISPRPEVLMKKAFPFDVSEIQSGLIDQMIAQSKPRVTHALQGRETEMRSVLEDLTIRSISWGDFSRVLKKHRDRFHSGEPDSHTVAQLIDGFIQEIDKHPKAGNG